MSEIRLKSELEIRLHTHQLGTNTRCGTEVNVMHVFIWLMCSELGYLAHILISGLNDGAATLSPPYPILPFDPFDNFLMGGDGWFITRPTSINGASWESSGYMTSGLCETRCTPADCKLM